MSGKDDPKKDDAKKKDPEKKRDEVGLELCLWASYRGQTLARTVRGMMYYERSDPFLVLSLVSCVTCKCSAFCSL